MSNYEEMKRKGQEKKEREEAEVKVLFPERVKQIAAAMGYTPRFHYKSGEPMQRCYAVIESGTRMISLTTSDLSPDFRLSVSGDYDMGPSELGISFPYGTPRPGITVNLRRDAAVIAKEIKARFLPDYDAVCTKIAEHVKQATHHRDSCRSNTARLAAIAGVTVRNVHGTKELQTEFHKYYGANYTGPRLEIKCSSDGATINLDGGVELIAAVIKAIEALATVANPNAIKQRLEYLRGELRAERISYYELAELQDLASHIDPSDVELLEAAGVPEQPSEIGTMRRRAAEELGFPVVQADPNDHEGEESNWLDTEE